MSRTGLIVRRLFSESDAIRDEGLTIPEDVERFTDILYGTDSKWQVLDVYRPKDREGETLPVIVNVHGGGWVYGTKESYQYYCMSLAKQGFAVVNYTYRLAPEFQFPASIEDENLVFHWVLSHGEEYGLDTNHIFAVGDSSGAQMLSLYCAICTNPEYAKEYSFSAPEGFVPTAIALNCGVYVMGMEGVSDSLTMKLMKEMMPRGGSKEEERLISVIYHVTKDFPPTILVTGSGDFTKHQAPVLKQVLEEHGVFHRYNFYGDEDHEVGHVFECNIRLPEAVVCNEQECGFFKSFL